jgi:hypothetical protein
MVGSFILMAELKSNKIYIFYWSYVLRTQFSKGNFKSKIFIPLWLGSGISFYL